MKYAKYFAGCVLAVGLLAAGAPTASAQDWRFERQGIRDGYNNAYGYRNSYDQREEMEQHIARDRAKLNEAIRCGNDAEAARQAADLARDQRELRELKYGQNAGYYRAPYNTYNRGWNFRFGWR